MSLYGPSEYEKTAKYNELMKAKFDSADIDEVVAAIDNHENKDMIAEAVRRRDFSYVGAHIEIALRLWWRAETMIDVEVWADEQEEANKAKYDGKVA